MPESMAKTPSPAQQLFAPIFLLEKGTALEENGGAFELWGRVPRVAAGALRSQYLFPFRASAGRAAGPL